MSKYEIRETTASNDPADRGTLLAYAATFSEAQAKAAAYTAQGYNVSVCKGGEVATAQTPRNDEEIACLKENWLSDPCWDIADTEGFEAHRAELEAFQAEQEAAWQAEIDAKLNTRAAELGCTPAMVALIERLESTIKTQAQEIEKLQDRAAHLEWLNRRAA